MQLGRFWKFCGSTGCFSMFIDSYRIIGCIKNMFINCHAESLLACSSKQCRLWRRWFEDSPSEGLHLWTIQRDPRDRVCRLAVSLAWVKERWQYVAGTWEKGLNSDNSDTQQREVSNTQWGKANRTNTCLPFLSFGTQSPRDDCV